MRKRRKLLISVIAVVLLLFAYPAFVVGYTWSHVVRSDLPGGRDGPLDAYRHTLASAVVAYTLDPVVVEWATRALERKFYDANAMDRHNNRIGARIGYHARSFSEIEPAVREQVLGATVNASDPAQPPGAAGKLAPGPAVVAPGKRVLSPVFIASCSGADKGVSA